MGNKTKFAFSSEEIKEGATKEGYDKLNWKDIHGSPVPKFDIATYEFTDTSIEGADIDSHSNIELEVNPLEYRIIRKQDVIAMAKHFNLTETDLKD